MARQVVQDFVQDFNGFPSSLHTPGLTISSVVLIASQMPSCHAIELTTVTSDLYVNSARPIFVVDLNAVAGAQIDFGGAETNKAKLTASESMLPSNNKASYPTRELIGNDQHIAKCPRFASD